MDNLRKDDILERLVFSEGAVEAYARPERERSESLGDHWTRPVLLERAAYLRKLARFSEGVASDTIREFPGYSLSLMVLLRSGDATSDDKHAYIFLVLDGHATLVSGGTLERAGTIAGGEVRGKAMAGGVHRELRRGDVVCVGGGIPHQFLISGERSLSCLVIRVDEGTDSPSVPGL